MRRKRVSCLWGAFLALLALATAATAQTWNLASSWSSSANPSGQWGYRAHFYPSNLHEMLDFHVPNYDGSGYLDAWQTQAGYTTPVVLKNVSTSNYTGLGMFAPAGKVIAQANTLSWGPWVWPAIVTWTAPAAGNYTYSVTFTGRGTTGNSLWTSVFKDYSWPIGQPAYEISKDTILANGQSFSHTGTLALTAGQTIDLLIHNKDYQIGPANNWCQIDATVTSAISIAEVRNKPDGTSVRMGIKIVSGVYSYRGSKFFYIEDPDRSAGIKVVSDVVVSVGDRVDVSGVVQTSNGEKQITSGTIGVVSGGPAPNPLGATSKAVAQGFAGQALSLQGHIIKVCGRVDYIGSDFFYIEDGAGSDDGSTMNLAGEEVKGLRMAVGSGQSMPDLGSFVKVVGCLGNFKESSSNATPVLWETSLAPAVSETPGEVQAEAARYLLSQIDTYLTKTNGMIPTLAYYQGRRVFFLMGISQEYRDSVQALLTGGGSGSNVLNYAIMGLKCAQAAFKQAQDPLASAQKSRPIRPIAYQNSFGPQQEICINGLWQCKFNAGPNTPPGSGWLNISVPHSASVETLPALYGLSSIILTQPTSPAWYRIPLYVPQDWSTKAVKIRFEGVAHYAEVYVNNVYCGNHVGSLSPFEVDVTDAVQPGTMNTIAVYAENESYSRVPDNTQQCFYSTYPYIDHPSHIGIHGDVFLKAYPLVSVQKSLVDTSVQNNQIRVRTWVSNLDSQAHTVTLNNSVQEGASKVLDVGAQSITVPAKSTVMVDMTRSWSSYKLWGIGGTYGDPNNLYHLVSKLSDGSQVVDMRYTRFGFREFKASGGKFYLNNAEIFLQDGGAIWHSYSLFSGVMARPYLFRAFNSYRKANCNIVRNFAPAYHTYFDVADEMGMLCEDQWITDGWIGSHVTRLPGGDPRDPVWIKHVEDEYQQWVENDYNHPSVVMWSSNNEVFQLSDPSISDALDTFIGFQDFLRSLDLSNRPVNSHGNLAYRSDPRFQVVSLHYPYLPWLDSWQYVYGGRPVQLGEFYAGEDLRCQMSRDLNPSVAASAETAMADNYSYQINYVRNLNLPSIGMHNLLAQGFFCSASLSKMGPWADEFRQPLTLYTDYWWDEYIPVVWPSQSGIGYRPPNVSARWSGPINWFDPTRVESTPNKVFDAAKNSYRPMPVLKSTLPPEVIATVINGANANVFVTPLDNQPVSPFGVKADSAGKAWLVLKMPGRYRVSAVVNGRTLTVDINTSEWNTSVGPGYSYIQSITLQ